METTTHATYETVTFPGLFTLQPLYPTASDGDGIWVWPTEESCRAAWRDLIEKNPELSFQSFTLQKTKPVSLLLMNHTIEKAEDSNWTADDTKMLSTGLKMPVRNLWTTADSITVKDEIFFPDPSLFQDNIENVDSLAVVPGYELVL